MNSQNAYQSTFQECVCICLFKLSSSPSLDTCEQRSIMRENNIHCMQLLITEIEIIQVQEFLLFSKFYLSEVKGYTIMNENMREFLTLTFDQNIYSVNNVITRI